jgi:hypothetical protein
MALLAAIALDLGHGHPVNADRGESLPDFVKLEWFDDGDHELHVQAFSSLEIRNSIEARKSGIFPRR